MEFYTNGSTKLLGIIWDKNTYDLASRVSMEADQGADTKRKSLSEIARIYDPSGLMSPFIVPGRILMWDTRCYKSFGWDNNLEWISLMERWVAIYKRMPCR